MHMAMDVADMIGITSSHIYQRTLKQTYTQWIFLVSEIQKVKNLPQERKILVIKVNQCNLWFNYSKYINSHPIIKFFLSGMI